MISNLQPFLEDYTIIQISPSISKLFLEGTISVIIFDDHANFLRSTRYRWQLSPGSSFQTQYVCITKKQRIDDWLVTKLEITLSSAERIRAGERRRKFDRISRGKLENEFPRFVARLSAKSITEKYHPWLPTCHSGSVVANRTNGPPDRTNR